MNKQRRDAEVLPLRRSDLGIEEFGEARVVRHVLEVGVGAGLDAVARVEADGLGEVLQAVVGISGHAGEDGESVKGIVGAGVLCEDGFEMSACVFVVAVVEQGDGEVETFLAGEELGLTSRGLLGACVDVHANPLGQFSGAGGEQLLEGGGGLVELAVLHEPEGGFVTGECLGALAAGGCGDGSGNGARTFGGGGSGVLHRASAVPVWWSNSRMGWEAPLHDGLSMFGFIRVGNKKVNPARCAGGSCVRFAGVDDGVEVGVVVHFELAVELETAVATAYLLPENVEAGGEVVALLAEQGEAVQISPAMGLGGGGALGLVGGVVELEREDREAVEDKSRGFGLQRGGGILLPGGRQQQAVDGFDQVVALLVEGVDGAFEAGYGGVGGAGLAHLVLLVP